MSQEMEVLHAWQSQRCIRIDLGTYCIKMTRHPQIGSTSRVPIADKYGEIITRNLICTNDWMGNELLYHYPQASSTSPIIYGITKHLCRSEIQETLADNIVTLLTRFFKYLFTMINEPVCHLAVIQPTDWSPNGVKVFRKVIDNMRQHYCITIIPFHAVIQQVISTFPFVLIDFGESLRCMHYTGITTDMPICDQLNIGGNDFTKIVIKMIRIDMSKQGLSVETFASPKLRHKLWIFAEKFKRILSANESFSDTFETPTQDYTILLTRARYQHKVEHLIAKYYDFVSAFFQRLPVHAACHVYIHGGVHRTPAIRNALQNAINDKLHLCSASNSLKTRLMSDHAYL